jgi:hypothetical protein
MSNNLDLDVLSSSQANKSSTIETIKGQLDAALTEGLTISVASGNAVPTNTQYLRNVRFLISGATTAGRTVTIPQKKRFAFVHADAANTQSVSLVRGATSVALAPGETAIIYTDGTADGLEVYKLGTSGSTVAGAPYTADAASRTLAIGDAGGFLDLSNASAAAYTIPANATVAFPVGTEISASQGGAGQVSFAAAGGVTIQTPSGATGPKTRVQYSVITAKKIATNTWRVFGDLG